MLKSQMDKGFKENKSFGIVQQLAAIYNVTSSYVRQVIKDVDHKKYKSIKSIEIRAAYKILVHNQDMLVNQIKTSQKK
jgi:undecaprenyl pyrophosphate phosphatase UppP